MTVQLMDNYGYIVDGNTCYADRTISVVDPANETELTRVPEAGQEGVDAAIESCQEVGDEWAKYDVSDRGRIFHNIADLIREETDRLAELETREVGRPLQESIVYVRGAAGYFEYYAGLTDKIEGRQIPLPGYDDVLDYTLREPYGVTAHVVPWNASTVLAARSIAPALATGNTVVAKSSSLAPLSTIEFTKLIHEAGLPDGVLNTITGSGSVTGGDLVTDPRIRAIEFTGSTDTGIHVMKAAAENLNPVHLELGGKGANIVFDDADIEAAVQSVRETFENAGQLCYAPTRIFVQTGIYDDFIDRAVSTVESMTLGPGMTNPDMGPLITASARDTVSGYVDGAKNDGGRVLTGGFIPDGQGYFYAPTLLDCVPDDAPIACEEVFGPVFTIHEFDTTSEVVDRVNDTNYGLSNLVWTRDLSRAHTVARALESGTVEINSYQMLSPAAVSGGYEKSGIGRAKGLQAIEAFTQTKNVKISLEDVV